jgi:hypothetical protein
MGNENQNTGSIRHLTVKELKPILDVFTQLTWPVPEAEIPILIEKLGWTFIANRVDIDADTHLPVDYPVGDFAKPHGELTRLMFHLTDTVRDMTDTAGLAAVQAAYPLLVGEIQSVWGEPTGSQEPQPEDTAKTWMGHACRRPLVCSQPSKGNHGPLHVSETRGRGTLLRVASAGRLPRTL